MPSAAALQLDGPRHNPFEPELHDRDELPDAGLPPGLSLTTRKDRLELSYRWFSFQIVFLLVFALFWNGFMAAWYVIALPTGEWLIAVFGVVHLAVGVGLGYGALAGLLNRTKITLRSGKLAVWIGPLPWFGGKEGSTAELDQLYVVERRTRTKNGVQRRYDLTAQLQSGGDLVLVRGMGAPHLAQAMERRLEEILGIVDRAMPGEYAG